MRSLEPCTEVAALQAATEAATGPDGGTQTVTGTIGDLIITWNLTAVAALLAEADEVGWAPDLAEADGCGLVVIHGGGLYRFDTDRPRSIRTGDGPGLRLITSYPQQHDQPGKAATA